MIDAKQYNTNSGGKKLPAGLHAKCKVSFDFGDNFMEVIFTNDQGYQNKRFWIPDPNKEKYDERKSATLSEFISFMKIFSPEEEVLELKAPDIMSFFKAGAALIQDDLCEVNIKVIPDRDGVYSEIPRYGWIERYRENFPMGLQFSKWELENRINRKSPVAPPQTDEPLLF